MKNLLSINDLSKKEILDLIIQPKVYKLKRLIIVTL